MFFSLTNFACLKSLSLMISLKPGGVNDGGDLLALDLEGLPAGKDS